MIRETEITPELVREIVKPGFLDDYLRITYVTRWPLQFRFMCGIYAISSIIGRRCMVSIPGWSSYPPVWIFLLGTSGIGKSQGLDQAYEVLKGAKEALGPTGVDLWAENLTSFNSSAVFQQIKDNHVEGPIEGGFLCEEGS